MGEREGGGGRRRQRSYPAADDEGTLKKPALRLESFHSSSSLIRRWQNASEGRRPCYVTTSFYVPDTQMVSVIATDGSLFSANSPFTAHLALLDDGNDAQ